MPENPDTTSGSGLHCVLGKCIGPPNGPMPECHAGCSFTMHPIPLTDLPSAAPPDDGKCCGFPEMGVCADCPDPETVEWGKQNPPKWIKTGDGRNVLPICGGPRDVKDAG